MGMQQTAGVGTCGSVRLRATSLSLDVTFHGDAGFSAETALNEGNEITFDPQTLTFSAPASNTEVIVVVLADGTVAEVGPGEETLVCWPGHPEVDPDGDGVCGGLDVCPGTVLPESVPTVVLRPNRHADTVGDAIFDSLGGAAAFTLADTGGCSCEQIIETAELGMGHTRFGCSTSAILDWIDGL